MITPHVVSWQWEGYRTAHRARRNLLLHALTAPLFVLGWIGLVALVVAGRASLAPLALLPVIVAVAAQGHGHKREEHPPQPFRSPLDVVVRLFVEQFVTFPRFVLSGGFARAWRDAR